MKKEVDEAKRLGFSRDMDTTINTTLEKLISQTGRAADLAREGKFAEAADHLLRMGVRGRYWTACRDAAGLPSDAASINECFAKIAAEKKARYAQ
jgi:hypothetical protein